MKPLALLIPLAALAIPAVADARPKTSVSRFFLTQDIQRGTVAPSEGNGGLQIQLYRDAVAAELNGLGFGPGGDSARYVYSIEFSRDSQPSTQRKPSFSIGLGGSSSGGGYYRGGSSVGGGLGIGFGGGRGQAAVTRLSVELRERGGSTVWEGRAETEDKPSTSEREIAARLASALFRDFPGVNGRTITVR